jgi:hypothetical protein
VTTTDVTLVGGGGCDPTWIVVAPETGNVDQLGHAEEQGTRLQELQPAAVFARHGVITSYDATVGWPSSATTTYSPPMLSRRWQLRPGAMSTLSPDCGPIGRARAPLACRRSSAVKFLITVGAVGVTPAVQTAWGYDQFLRHAGVGAELPHTLEITALRTMVSAGLFPEANFDPVPVWQQVRQPVLAEWGEFDRVALPRESSTAIEDALRRGGNTRYTMRFISGVRHNLNLTADGGFDRIMSLPADYGAYERHWLDDLARTEPSRLGTPPTRRYRRQCWLAEQQRP